MESKNQFTFLYSFKNCLFKKQYSWLFESLFDWKSYMERIQFKSVNTSLLWSGVLWMDLFYLVRAWLDCSNAFSFRHLISIKGSENTCQYFTEFVLTGSIQYVNEKINLQKNIDRTNTQLLPGHLYHKFLLIFY